MHATNKSLVGVIILKTRRNIDRSESLRVKIQYNES